MNSGQPVILVPSDVVAWARRYAAIAGRIRVALPCAEIEHIGSTAVPDLPAKDVVDILVGVEPSEVDNAADTLARGGFVLEGSKPGHHWLAFPTTAHRTSVVHVVAHGGTEWTARLAFRDLLRKDAAARSEYLATKLAAAAEASNWGDYTAAKWPTIARLLDS